MSGTPEPEDRPDQTIELLRKAHSGDQQALNQLFERLAPPLQRWARGRLPGWARGMVSTVDLVQEALLSTFRVIERTGLGKELAIHAYVRSSLKSRLIDELRKVQRRPALQEMDQSFDSDQASPIEEAIGADALQRYEAALDKLGESSREALIARVELGLSYAEIAELTGKSSADAARMSVSRSLVKLAEVMSDE